MGWARGQKLHWKLGVSTMAAICNESMNTLTRHRIDDDDSSSGRYHDNSEPSPSIPSGQSGAFFHRKKEWGACGSVGLVRYNIIYTDEEKVDQDRGTVTIEWSTPYSGDNEAWVKLDDRAQQYVCGSAVFKDQKATSPQITFTLKDTEPMKKLLQERKDAKKLLQDTKVKDAKRVRDQLKVDVDRLKQDLDAAKKDRDELKQRLKEKERKVEEEEAAIHEFKDEREDKDAKLIVMVGKTGSGKSTTANRILGDKSEDGDGKGSASGTFFVASDASESCTQTNLKKTVTINQHKISVVDTPGYSDTTEGKDRVHCINLCKYIRGCGGINAFVFVHNERRFSNDFQNMLEVYREMFGAAFFTRLVIVFTGYDSKKQKKDWANNKLQPEGKKGLTGDICDKFKLHFQIPAIPIGLEAGNYEDAVTLLADAIPDDKLVIKDISSPLDDDKKQCVELKSQVNDETAKVLELQEKHFEKKNEWREACDKVDSLTSKQ